MNRRTSVILMRLLFAAVLAVFLGIAPGLRAQNNGNGQGKGNPKLSPGQVKQQARQSARQNAGPVKAGATVKFAGISPATSAISPLATGAPAAAVMTAGATPDYFGVPNYANSPLPTVTSTGAITAGTGIQKFVNTLPGLGAANANNLGTYIPLAVADTSSFPGSDLYQIGLQEYTHRFHSSLPATNVRGYYDIGNVADVANHYLGPLILATRNRAVRVVFTNNIATDLNIPVDTTYMGAGAINDGTHSIPKASERRATLHLHGGNTPWISDGTTHQWITPSTDPLAVSTPFAGFTKGFSSQNVPGMAAGTLIDGKASFYWTNQQSGRLMFYHDHAYGITRLNVYAGEAAGYLLVDGTQEAGLRTATAPGTILTKNDPSGALDVFGNPSQVPIITDLITPANNADLGHLIPLVIQDKTFVPDPNTQLALEDPTWDTIAWGGLGSLWYPHVYTPNQNPSDLTGANGFGRWDWGPWFLPPQNPATLIGKAFACPGTSAGQPTAGWAFPPLMCPGVPYWAGATGTTPATIPNSPSGVPEGFMDTPVVNGTAYPSLTVAPAAYRFQVLNAANDRTLNLGLYLAEPVTLSVIITNPGSNYTAPTVVVGGCTGGTAIATVGSGTFNGTAFTNGITAIDMLTQPAAPCTAPTFTISDTTPGVGSGAAATAVISTNTEVKMVPAVQVAARTMPNCSTSPATQPTMWGGGQVTAVLDPTGNPINGTGLPAGCWPLYNSVSGFTAGPMGEKGALSWGNSDGRIGGVPDPTTAGPPIIQIGAEGGLLPKVAVIPSTPISYDYNKRSITVLNVLNHGLLLGPAERADIIVDFTAFSGKTLILYNDAPAPVPGADPRLDYYTNDVDYSSTGGAPTTMAGYGPNIRTIMQINVTGAANPNVPAFSLPALAAALPTIFAQTQDPVILGEPDYPAANGNGPANYLRIQDNTVTGWTGPIGGVTLTSGGAGYTSVPTVTFTGGGGKNAAAVATLAPAAVASFNVTNGGSGYTSAPNVAISGGGGTGATATAVLATSGSVKSIAVTNGGSGYLAPPTVNITAPPAGGAQATATATVQTSGQRRVTAITVTNPGSGYLVAPTISFTPVNGGSGAAATATLGNAVASLTLTNGGSGYSSAPVVAFSGGGGTGAAATAVLAPRVVSAVTLTDPGIGYNSAPTVAFVGGGFTNVATAIATPPTVPLLDKAIQELFTLDYGRMNATLGVELALTSFLTQTTIPYGYVDPPTEIFKDGETQFWKITHNGVDTHFIHFHLFTVQVINRVGWDGAIKPPDPNELGFKDTVRMNPLEDIIVALRPFKQTVPFAVPSSWRPMDTTMPVGSAALNEFTNVDPTNQPAAVTNAKINFGWEYVWHCHILGHEENDMMRAMILAVAPNTPTAIAATGGSKGTITLSLKSTASGTNPVPTSFTVFRGASSTGPFTSVGSVAATLDPTGTIGTATFTDSGLASKTTYFYVAVANNLVGYTQTYPAPAAGYPTATAMSGTSLVTSAAAR